MLLSDAVGGISVDPSERAVIRGDDSRSRGAFELVLGATLPALLPLATWLALMLSARPAA